MNSPPAARPSYSSPETPGSQAAPGVWLRDADGNGGRRISAGRAERLVAGGVALRVSAAGDLRLRAGIRMALDSDLSMSNGMPDLSELQRRQPERYAAFWRGTKDARTGKGALGRSRTDRTVFANR